MVHRHHSIPIDGGPQLRPGDHGSSSSPSCPAPVSAEPQRCELGGGQAMETGCLPGSLSYPLLPVQWQVVTTYFLDQQRDMSIVRIMYYPWSMHGCLPVWPAVCRGCPRAGTARQGPGAVAPCMGESDEATGGSNTCMAWMDGWIGDACVFMHCTA